MQIIVNGKVVETKEIADIVDIEAGKTMFLNREAGFRIIFLDPDTPDMVFKENIPYESYTSQISAIKEAWKQLMDRVVEQWKTDKTEIPSFNI